MRKRSRSGLARVEMDRRSSRLAEVKHREPSKENPGGGFDGIAQMWAPHTNDWNERFVYGCFDKSIAERVKGPNGTRVRLNNSHGWDCEDVIGSVMDAGNRPEGLWVSCDFSTVDDAQETRTKMKEKHLDELSIEFRSVLEQDLREDDGRVRIRVVQEAVLWGLAVVPYSSQEVPAILEVRSAAPYQDLPLAPWATAWDPAGARERVTAWSKGEQPPNGHGINTARLRRAFVLEDREDTGLEIQIADVIDGKLYAVPAALMRGAARLQSLAAGDGPELDGAVLLRAQDHLDRYFDRFPAEHRAILPPWRYGLDALALELRSGIALAPALLAAHRETIQFLATAAAAAEDVDEEGKPKKVKQPDKPAGPPATPPMEEQAAPTVIPDDEEERASALRNQNELRQAELRMAELGLAYDS